MRWLAVVKCGLWTVDLSHFRRAAAADGAGRGSGPGVDAWARLGAAGAGACCRRRWVAS